MNADDKTKIQKLPGNSKCIDCSTPNPTWASISHGTLHCFECIGKHRGLGVHISFARSLTLDSWNDQQLKYLTCSGGNAKFQTFLQEHDRVTFGKDRIRQVYDNPVAGLYRAKLKARVEGRPEPADLGLDKVGKNSNKPKATPTPATSTPTPTPTQSSSSSSLTSHLMKSKMPTAKQRFLAGFKYYSYNYVLTPILNNYITSTATFLLYITSKCTSITSSKPNVINTIFRNVILSTLSSIILLSFYSIHWIRHHRHEAFKSSYNLFLSRSNNGRIKRNSDKYDMYFPKNNTDPNTASMIGTTIQNAFLFFPESLVDITSYSNIMSKLSDAGILVIVVNCNPTRIVTPYHKGATLNDTFQIIFEVEKLMGITVQQWILGGHGDGAMVALEIRRSIALHQTKKKTNEIKKGMKCVCWGITSSPKRFSSSSSSSSSLEKAKNTLFLTASNDTIAGKMRLESTIGANWIEKSSFEYCSIDGGNHSGFGHYGPQTFPRMDGPCAKTIDGQQTECWRRTLDFILEREHIVSKQD